MARDRESVRDLLVRHGFNVQADLIARGWDATNTNDTARTQFGEVTVSVISHAELVRLAGIDASAALQLTQALGQAGQSLVEAAELVRRAQLKAEAVARLTEAEKLVYAALVTAPRSEAEIAAAAGYSVRYAQDLLAELFKRDLAYKAHGGRWIRA